MASEGSADATVAKAAASPAGSTIGWLFSQPIAHRGLHRPDGPAENTLAAAFAAAEAGFGVECDVRLSADGEAVVVHDAALDRLTGRSLRVDTLTAADLGAVPIRGGRDTIPTLTALLDAIDGRVPVVVEVKSGSGFDLRLVARVAELCRDRPMVAIKSFDPRVVGAMRRLASGLPRGIVAQSRYDEAETAGLGAEDRHAMANLLHIEETRPDFLSWRFADLPNAAVHLCRVLAGIPAMTWTIRSPEDAVRARSVADQIVFEGFSPG